MGQRDRKLIVGLIAGSIFLIGLYAIEIPRLYSVVMYADDFHYWAAGAFWAGIDWSSMVRHDFYYSYGYGFLLAPLFAFTRDGIILFRMGILLNYVFLVLSYLLLIKTGMLVYGKASRLKIGCICLVACIYPSWRIYLNSTMCEVLLYFLFILTVFLLVKIDRGGSSVCAVFQGFLAVYIYMVHQRMIVVTIALTTVMVIMYLLKKINSHLFFDYMFTMIFSFGVHGVIKPVFKDFLYVNYSTLEVDRNLELKGILLGIWLKILILYLVLTVVLFIVHKTKLLQWLRNYRGAIIVAIALFVGLAISSFLGTPQTSTRTNNDYTSVIEKFTSLFTNESFLPFLRTVMGHIFYAFIGSGGLAIYNVFCFFADILHVAKNKECDKDEAMELYILITVILIVGLSCVSLSNRKTSRIDMLIYGRYYEFVMPVLLVIGFLKIEKERVRWREFWSSILLFCGIAYFVYEYYKQGEMFHFFTDTRFLSTNSSAVYWEFSNQTNGVLAAFAVGIVIAIICVVMNCSHNKALPYIFCLLLGALFGIQGKMAIEAYMIPQQELQNEGNVIAETIMDYCTDYEIYFMKDAYEAFHCSAYFQVRMPKVHILSLRDEQVEDLGEKSIVICDAYDTESCEVLEEAEFKILEKCATAVCYIRNGEQKE